MELFVTLQNFPILFACLMFIIGICIGSFLNVLIYRLPRMLQQSWRAQCYVVLNMQENYTPPRLNLFAPRSHCPYCKKQIPMWRNIPLVSYLIQKGRCHHCTYPISIAYPTIELLTGIITFLLAWQFGITFSFLAAAAFSWCLIPLIVIDFKYQILPDEISLFLLWCGLFFNMFSLFTAPPFAIGGAILGYVIFWLLAKGFYLIRKIEGMGHGDFKLNAALGAWFGMKPLIMIILLSAILGLIVGLTLMLFKRLRREQPFAFGPYLAIAGWVYLMWGPTISMQFWHLLQ